MVREIMHDPVFLAQKSAVATAEDLPIAQDLLDTLEAHRHECVGIAANMIGELKRIIVFVNGEGYMTMLNPEIIQRSQPYDTVEGCISLLGDPRKVRRYKTIKVKYQTRQMQMRMKTFSGYAAQIIQHEVDHCNGVLI